MSQTKFPFAYRKATQALNLLARQAGGRLDKLKALKLVFFADRYHLRKYARLLTNDEYWAMDWGPVPSGVKDLIEMGPFLGRQERSYAEKFLTPVRKADNCFQSAADVDRSLLSATDIEALEFAWRTFGRFTPSGLSRISHRYPEWSRHEAALKSKQVSRLPIVYEDFLTDPPRGLDPCFPLSEQDREDRREALKELQAFEAKWN